ncbi:zeta toxin [Gallibacterium salpingitidis]|uniref:Zeta toxin n=1 Tax=Gallibacterium salpingitidis TaxID=505341 RepID=A0AB36E427_9PAST|nr:zeta toxin family protein [Gallibacterium salpingitidis]OBX07954.1 zeta toxin [Gallibacterium salpingitidis]OBX11453.1 zeta toxin [Gallibacterium salpingitidis]WKT00752.1 zeta toxin family protein [Gallibacterium salpingitidis]
MANLDKILKQLDSYDLQQDINKKFPKIWTRFANNPFLSPQNNPIGVLLGGQPGAGKAFATMEIKKRLNNNILVINGDEFRSYHRHYEDFYTLYGKDASKYTAAFAGTMVGKIRDEAIKQGFNILIEGTFRTLETPLKEINNFVKNGYRTEIVICTCPKELSWESTLQRAIELETAGLQPRYVPRETHDLVVAKLAENVEKVFQSKLVSHLEVYSRDKKLFDSDIEPIDRLIPYINQELDR